ncbi:hypothetical protein PCASD_17942, partial [Puccinia coronata f. sp. avenae]
MRTETSENDARSTHDESSSSSEEGLMQFAFAVNGWKIPSMPVEDLKFSLCQIMPEVVLVSSKAEDDLTSCIEKADIPGGIEKTPTILKRPSREYNAADGFNKLQQLSVRNRDGTVFPGGTSCSTPSTTVTAHDDTKFSKNSNLTASAFLGAVAALLAYLQGTVAGDGDSNVGQRGLFVSKVEMIKTQKFMHLGSDAIKSLQIFDQEAHANLHFSKTKEGLSLYGILNECITHNGKLLLRNWLLRPSTKSQVIESRHDAIECFLESGNADHTGKMRKDLKLLGNISRTTMIISSGKSRVGEWGSLINSIHACQALYEDFSKLKISNEVPLFNKMKRRSWLEEDLEPLASKINEMIDWSESKINGGRVTIRQEFDEELDDYREQYSSMESHLSSLAENISSDSPYNSLPGFSINYFPQVWFDLFYIDDLFIGYLCATPFAAQSGSIDPSTLDDWEFQFSTDTEEHYKNGLMRELDHHYGDLATAIDDREIELLHLLEEEVSKFTGILLTANDDLAELDCLLSLAKVNFERAWVRPKIVEENIIQIISGRHPLVEGCVESYVPNDTHLVTNYTSKAQQSKRKDNEPHLGSFVPAEEAHIGIHDAIFTRVSTTESASHSSSAFMIDLQRVSFMLRNCTMRSILLIDEFGKGTDPTDGEALFCGVIQHLISRGSSCPITLVSTHFHEVFTKGFLSLDLPIDYTHMSIFLNNGGESEDDVSPTYLYKLAPDLVSSSHAMGCAAQAGVPRHIRMKAERVSRLLSRYEILELLDIRLDEEEREELRRMEGIVRRFLA